MHQISKNIFNTTPNVGQSISEKPFFICFTSYNLSQDLVTHARDQEVQSVSRRLMDNLVELAQISALTTD